MKKFFEWICTHRKFVLIFFAVCTGVSLLCKSFVAVNYDMNDYLPEDSPSTVSLDLMEQEFSGGIPNARVMLRDITIPQALAYKEKLLKIDGVTKVLWLDDVVDVTVPLHMADHNTVETYYKDSNALFSITIADDKRVSTVNDLRNLIGDENAMEGSAVATATATTGTISEIPQIAVIAVIFVLFILLLTTTSWIEPLVVMCGLGIAVIINAGSNLIFGEISFVTNAAGNILQLAVSLDYSVFLLHRFMECRKETDNTRAAMVNALCKSTSSILSSGLTTVIGFLALCLMQFGIGPDLGLALAKGIAISLIVVFVFSPALILSTYKLVDKTHHRSFMPSFNGLGKLVQRVMIPAVAIFALLIVPANLASNSNDFYYGSSHIFSEETQLGKDMRDIEKVFCKSDTYVLLVPRGNLAEEQNLSEALKELPQVRSIISYVNMAGAEVPLDYLDSNSLAMLMSNDYSRLVISLDTDYEGKETFALVEEIRKVAAQHYPQEYYLAGEGVSTYDLMDTITSDMVKVNFIAIGAVFLVLLISMKSVVLPIILVLSIETAIWINLAFPFFGSSTIFYIAYLIISSVQLGATVDYAILLTERYREVRHTFEKKEAVVQTIGGVTLSILTSSIVLTLVGFLLGIISTHGVLSQLGLLLGSGTLCSLVIVLFVLPGLLYILDRWIVRDDKKKRIGGSYTMIKKKIFRSTSGRIMAIVLVAALLAANMGTVAAASEQNTSKQEIVYINLNSDGSVSKVYVVNTFELSEDGKIVDYGDYTSLRNMTSDEKIVYEDETITIDTKAGKLYYEGFLSNNSIPWDFSIRYYLNDTELPAEELAGKTGALKIKMSIRENADCDSPFFENYALQASFTLDTKLCKNIVAKDATTANVGRKKQITYTILPNKGADALISANVTDFEMDGIAINGVPLSMNLDVKVENDEDINEASDGIAKLDDGASDMTSGAAKLRDGASDLKDGASELKDGAETLNDGAADLKEGASDIKSGAKDLQSGSKELLAGSNDVKQGAKDLHTGISELYSKIPQLITGSTSIDNGLSDAKTGASNLANGAKGIEAGASELKNGADSISVGLNALSSQSSKLIGGAYTVFASLTTQAEKQINQSLSAMGVPTVSLTPENYDVVLTGLLEVLGGNTSQAILAIKAQLDEYNQFYLGLKDYTNAVGAAALGADSLKNGTDALALGASDLRAGATSLYDGIMILKDGSAEMLAGLTQLQSGCGKLLDGVISLEDGTVQLRGGIVELSDGTIALLDGATTLNDGVIELCNGTLTLKDGCVEALDGAIALYDGSVTLYDGTLELKDGTLEFRDKTADIDTTINDKITSAINDMMGTDFEPASFVSDKNTNVEFVQFVVRTDAIEKADTVVTTISEEVPLTFWQKFLRLFRF